MSVFFGANNIVSPLGFTTAQNFGAIRSGESAINKQTFDFSQTPFHCATIKDDLLDSAFEKFSGNEHYTRLEKMCILSIDAVIKESGIDLSDKNNLLILSTTKGNIDVLEGKYPHLSKSREYLPVFSGMLSDKFNCANFPLLVSNACISGLLAIIIAKRFIENKTYKNVIVCGADLVSEFTLSGFKSLNALSDDYCKPFDAFRKGINLGEAAASILLSVHEVSNICVRAGSSANDANHISGPSRTGDGLFAAISNTILNCDVKKFDFISAHGTATEYNDEMESAAFFRAALHQTPLNSLKGYFGHTLGAAGVLESIMSIESLKNNVLIKSQGYEVQGTTHLDNVIREAVNSDLRTCLKTASGFGGCNAAAIFEKI